MEIDLWGPAGPKAALEIDPPACGSLGSAPEIGPGGSASSAVDLGADR